MQILAEIEANDPDHVCKEYWENKAQADVAAPQQVTTNGDEESDEAAKESTNSHVDDEDYDPDYRK